MQIVKDVVTKGILGLFAIILLLWGSDIAANGSDILGPVAVLVAIIIGIGLKTRGR